jgi:hypothetical protein
MDSMQSAAKKYLTSKGQNTGVDAKSGYGGKDKGY